MTVPTTEITGAMLAKLRAEFAGSLLLPDDRAYDQARRVWNGMPDRRPSLIARCTGASDVSAAVRFATGEGLPVTVRGGGHNVAGTAVDDDTVMIDLSPMRGVTVDPARAVATAEGGCLLSDLDAATAPHGLACPAGVVSHTGLAGLTLGGGYGWLARKWGLTCDHLLAAEVVLADGSVVEATGERHPELFWALHGGGGNFGIVTRFTLRLRPVGRIHHRTAVHSLADAPAALAEYRAFAEKQSGDLHAVGAFKVAGDQEWIPRGLRGRPALFLATVRLGDPGPGPAMSDPVSAGPAVVADRVLSYPELQALGDHGEPHGNRYFTKSCYLSELGGGVAAELVGAAREITSPLSSIDFEYLRGAIADVPDEESAFPRRDAPYICTASAQWTDPGADRAHEEWSRRTVQRLSPWQYGGAYVNYAQGEAAEKVVEVYGAARYDRLAAVKRIYDPGNLLSRNQNIRPSAP
ncbi:FAD-binding oxidoreductase [Streptomyces jumonjinensis]|uniref:FAD-binding oxidoreductase n=1 Tax=Streptomyces jumonjinensis TaxID=1945 RepID=UPI00379F9400